MQHTREHYEQKMLESLSEAGKIMVDPALTDEEVDIAASLSLQLAQVYATAMTAAPAEQTTQEKEQLAKAYDMSTISGTDRCAAISDEGDLRCDFLIHRGRHSWEAAGQAPINHQNEG